MLGEMVLLLCVFNTFIFNEMGEFVWMPVNFLMIGTTTTAAAAEICIYSRRSFNLSLSVCLDVHPPFVSPSSCQNALFSVLLLSICSTYGSIWENEVSMACTEHELCILGIERVCVCVFCVQFVFGFTIVRDRTAHFASQFYTHTINVHRGNKMRRQFQENCIQPNQTTKEHWREREREKTWNYASFSVACWKFRELKSHWIVWMNVDAFIVFRVHHVTFRLRLVLHAPKPK